MFNIDYFQVYVTEGLLIVSRETLPIILNSLPNKRLLKKVCEGAGRPQSPANQLFHVEQSQIYTYKQITKHKYYKRYEKVKGDCKALLINCFTWKIAALNKNPSKP